FLAVMIYVVIALGAILAIPFDEIIQNKEYALAAGANGVLGHWGTDLVIIGALLATSSAISGTVFGASRQMSIIAADGYLPNVFAKRNNNIPVFAIIGISFIAFMLILAGSLQVILEFGSITFLIVSLLMAVSNYKIRALTNSSTLLTLLAIFGLSIGTVFILFYEYTNKPEQLVFIVSIYAVLAIGSWFYAKSNKPKIDAI
ncbi:MAG TPA: amino acid permease, partial [Thiomicrospira sp.]|nr:amino acid permease [Thiomicrospira sp.]